jgi:hypothetical protein
MSTEELPPLEWCECHHQQYQHVATVPSQTRCEGRGCVCTQYWGSLWRPNRLVVWVLTKKRDLDYELGHSRSLRAFLRRRRLVAMERMTLRRARD